MYFILRCYQCWLNLILVTFADFCKPFFFTLADIFRSASLSPMLVKPDLAIWQNYQTPLCTFGQMAKPPLYYYHTLYLNQNRVTFINLWQFCQTFLFWFNLCRYLLTFCTFGKIAKPPFY